MLVAVFRYVAELSDSHSQIIALLDSLPQLGRDSAMLLVIADWAFNNGIASAERNAAKRAFMFAQH